MQLKSHEPEIKVVGNICFYLKIFTVTFMYLEFLHELQKYATPNGKLSLGESYPTEFPIDEKMPFLCNTKFTG